MNKVINYIKEAYNELVHKVSWPTQQELTSSTVVVMTASIIMAVVVFGIDFSFKYIINFFYENIVR